MVDQPFGETLYFREIRVETFAAPIFVVRYPSDYLAEDLVAVLDWLAEHTSEHPHIATIHDARSTSMPPGAAGRKAIMDKASDVNRVLASRVVSTAIVTSNPLVRGALTAILWLFRPTNPLKVMMSMDEAVQWTRERFVTRGVAVPDSTWKNLTEFTVDS